MTLTYPSLEAMARAVIAGDKEAAARLAGEGLAARLEARNMIEQGFIPGIRKVGDLWEEGEYFLPELMASAEAMKAAMAVLKPALESSAAEGLSLGRIVLGTIEGDIHDIGKNLVGSMLSANGFDVIDLGADVKLDRFIDEAVAAAGGRDRPVRAADDDDAQPAPAHRPARSRRAQESVQGPRRGRADQPGLGRGDRRRRLWGERPGRGPSRRRPSGARTDHDPDAPPRSELLAGRFSTRSSRKGFTLLERDGRFRRERRSPPLFKRGGPGRRRGVRQRVRIRRALVRTSLATAPALITLLDRSGERAYDRRRRRGPFRPRLGRRPRPRSCDPARAETPDPDLIDIARVADACAHIDFQSTALVASDVPAMPGRQLPAATSGCSSRPSRS